MGFPISFGEGEGDDVLNESPQADFLRNGTAKGIMTLSREDSTRLWKAVQDRKFNVYFNLIESRGLDGLTSIATDDLPLYNSVHQKLLDTPGVGLKHIPLRVYLPSSDPAVGEDNSETATGKLRVLQSLVPPMISSSKEASPPLPSSFLISHTGY